MKKYIAMLGIPFILACGAKEVPSNANNEELSDRVAVSQPLENTEQKSKYEPCYMDGEINIAFQTYDFLKRKVDLTDKLNGTVASKGCGTLCESAYKRMYNHAEMIFELSQKLYNESVLKNDIEKCDLIQFTAIEAMAWMTEAVIRQEELKK